MRLNAWAVFAVGFLGTSACAQESKIDPEAAAVIARTHETHATYSLYNWVVLPDQRSPHEEWNAEFHDGTSHRVETPRDRLIADCAAETGTHLNVETDQITRAPGIARAACGIDSNAEILSARVLEHGDGVFGPTTTLEITDARNVRTYVIAQNGAIVAQTIADRNGKQVLTQHAVAMIDRVADDIFSEQSLASSAVAEEFRRKPAA